MKLKNLSLSLLIFAAYPLILWQPYDMYIGTVLTAIINIMHSLCGGLFAWLFWLWRSSKLKQEDVGMYCWLLFFAALCNGVFTTMAWGAWVGLPLSVIVLLCIFINRKKLPQ